MRGAATGVQGRQGVAAALIVFALTLSLACAPTESSDTPPRYTAAERRAWFYSGSVWKGGLTEPSPQLETLLATRRLSMLTQVQLGAYSNHPLYWFGESYGGFNLQPPYGSLEYGDFRLALPYGQFITQNDGEPLGGAITLSIFDGCRFRPYARDGVARGKLETVRGGALVYQNRDGAVFLWTSTIYIELVYQVDTSRAKRAINDLRGWGPLTGHIGPGDPLPPPDFSHCPA